MKGQKVHFKIKFTVFFLVVAALTGMLWLFPPPARDLQAATCPFIDNDGNDGDATVGVYSLNVNFAVPFAATAYDCTSGSGITTFVIPNTKTLTLNGDNASGGTGQIAAINFTNLTVNVGGRISADNKGCTAAAASHGYAPNGSNSCTLAGPGAGLNFFGGSGAGHGGTGGNSTGGAPSGAGGAIYDSVTAPVRFGASGGSSGGIGGNGGGVVRLSIAGTFTHDGIISANATNGTGAVGYGAGGGSGGAVYVTAATINGSGTFEAKGGNGADESSGDGGGGGAGRIAVTFTGGSFSFAGGSFDMTAGTAASGQGATAGTKGTVYVHNTATSAVQIFHGFTWTDTDYSVTSWTTDPGVTEQFCDPGIASSATPSVSATTITLGGTLNCTQSTTSFTFSASGTLSTSASALISVNAALNLSGGSGFSLASGSIITTTKVNSDMTFTVPAGSQNWANVTINVATQGDLIMSSAVALTLSGTTSVNASVQWTNLTDLTIDSGTFINANAKGCTAPSAGNGFAPNSSNVCVQGGPGYGADFFGGAGGGHGGTGGNSSGGGVGGATYDSATVPARYGASGGSSGGVGGTGGGLVRLNVTGTFTHNGTIRANGTDGTSSGAYGAGGGSGGGVHVTVATMNGTTGTFEAKGGAGAAGSSDRGGGAGGGRVAITLTGGSYSFVSASFDMSAGVSGGAGAGAGAKGTVFVNNTTANTVRIFHGFTYTDTDYSYATWTFDGATTNQYCDVGISTGATPSITTTSALAFNGAFNCGKTIASFTFSSAAGVSTAASSVINVPGAVTLTTSAGALSVGASASVTSAGALLLSGNTSFSIGSGATIADTTANTDITFTIPAGPAGDQTWTNVTINAPVEGDLVISSAIAITLSGTTSVNASVQWTNLTNLTVDSGTFINANAKGCVGVAASHGYAPNSSNLCVLSGPGSGVNFFGGSGAGHGGAGGNSSGGATGGATYDSDTVPARYGASGGSSGGIGGSGGGLVRLNVTGTFTLNGTVRANGGNGTAASGYGGGGGSGGAVHVTVGTISGTTGTFEAKGGNGGADSADDGGGGGGGRVSISYATNGSTFLASLTAAGVATHGIKGGTAQDGSDGTLILTATDSPPVVTVVTHTPASPFTTDSITLSGTATDNAGIVKIEIFLDGTAPANLKHTCNIAPTTPATCQINVGTLASGSHTTTVRAYDAALQMAQGTENFSVSGSTTAGQMVLGRSKVGVSTSFTLAFALSGTSTGTLTVTFPAQFTVTAAGSGGASSACLSSFGFTSTTLTATKTSCSGTVTLGGATITNPATPGTYIITWTNDSGSGSLYITAEDQVGVSGIVDPILTFNVGAQASATACDGTFAGSGGTVALGVLSPSTVSSSDASSVSHICTRMTTNGTLGAIVTVRSLNAGLRSTSTPGDIIPSNTTTLIAGTPGFGLCAGSAGADLGRDTTTPVGATPTRSAPFNGASCTSAGHDVGALTTGNQNLWNIPTPSQNAFFRLYIKAAISPTTPAHNDYSDTLTFVATGTY